jgi:hypothetical protein
MAAYVCRLHFDVSQSWITCVHLHRMKDRGADDTSLQPRGNERTCDGCLCSDPSALRESLRFCSKRDGHIAGYII